MDDYHIQGDFARAEDGSIDGWCWSPDRPDERLIVEVLADGSVLAAVAANTFRRDLARQGKGDGRHGFAIAASELKLPAGSSLLSLRERETRRIFGQRRLGPVETQPNSRLDRLAREIRGLRSRVEAIPEGDATARTVRRGFRAVASRLDADTHGVVAAAFHALSDASYVPSRRPPRADIRPEFTLVVRVRDATHVAPLLRSCGPELAAGTADLVISEASPDPNTGLLAAVLPSAHFLPASGCPSLIAALTRAATRGGGRYIIAVDAGEGTALSRSGLAACVAAMRGGAKMLIGPRTTRYAAQLGFPDAVPTTGVMPRAGTESVICAIDRALLLASGAPSPASDEMIAATVLEMALRAALLGESAVWIDQTTGPVRAPAAETIEAIEAGRVLLMRYGLAP
jgi:hypothetical protein